MNFSPVSFCPVSFSPVLVRWAFVRWVLVRWAFVRWVLVRWSSFCPEPSSYRLTSFRSDLHVVGLLCWPVECTMIIGWLQLSNECNTLHLVTADRPSLITCLRGPLLIFKALIGIHQFLFVCLFSLRNYALDCETNTAATLRVFRAGYLLRRSHWLKLLGWFAAQNPLWVQGRNRLVGIGSKLLKDTFFSFFFSFFF